MTLLLTTGLYHVVENGGSCPFWVEARTHRRIVLVGGERRVKGLDSLYKATALMRKLTKEALARDPSLSIWVTDAMGATPQAASSEVKPRGRPLGSKGKPKRVKPGPVPKPKKISVPFYSTRFIMRPEGSNATAQVWQCDQGEANSRGRMAGKARKADSDHGFGSYAVSVLVDQKLEYTLDDYGRPLIYDTFWDAERDAIYLHDSKGDPERYPPSGTLQYVVGRSEVHLTPGNSAEFPYSILDLRYHEYRRNPDTGDLMMFSRLDTAIASAEDFERNAVSAPARIAKAFSDAFNETPAEKAERELREAAAKAKRLYDEERQQEMYEEEMRQLARQKTVPKRYRVLTGDEAREAKRIYEETHRRNQIKNPTQAQKNQARRAKYVHKCKDQRGAPE